MNEPLGQTAIEINCMGKPCPMPLLMLKRELKRALPHQIFLLMPLIRTVKLILRVIARSTRLPID